MRRQSQAVRGLKKRQLADEYFQRGAGSLLDVSVDDGTIVVYCKALAAFLDWHELAGEGALRKARDYDRALAAYFAHVCFGLRLRPHVAGSALAAVLYFRSELRQRLPRAARAARAFRALVRTPERLPFSRRSVGAIIATLLLQGRLVAAMVVAYAFDIVARGEQDWRCVRAGDAHLPHDCTEAVGVTLGAADRGEKTKTGFDQGALVHAPLAKGWLRARVSALRAAGQERAPVFDITPQTYRTAFKEALHALDLPAETPHILRHTAASELYARTVPRMELRDLMMAGRWGSESSVRRYTKPHLISAHEAIVAPWVLELGDAFWADPVPFVQRGQRAERQLEARAPRAPQRGRRRP